MRIADARKCEDRNLADFIRYKSDCMIVMTSKQLEALGVKLAYLGETAQPYQCLIRCETDSRDHVRSVTLVEKGADISCDKCGDLAEFAYFSCPVFWCERCDNTRKLEKEMKGSD